MSQQTISPFYVLKDTDQYVVVDKKPNISFHCENELTGLCQLVSNHIGVPLFPVHRLDKPTSGILIFAKTPEFACYLSTQFKARQVQKYYLAISCSKPQKKQGWVIGDMEKSRRGSWKLCRSRQNPAITYFYSHAIKAGLRGYLLKPYTGKTHQLRVAMQSISASILGDERYGKHLEADRLYLHAYCLIFNDGQQQVDITQSPQDGELFVEPQFQEQLELWQKPWSLKWPSPPHTTKT